MNLDIQYRRKLNRRQKYLIETFTDKDDVVIDPCAGSGTTLLASRQLRRHLYGFEIDRTFYKSAVDKVISNVQFELF